MRCAPKAGDCMVMMSPGSECNQCCRRIAASCSGPPLQMAQNSRAHATGEHDFCPCCLFTNSIEAFEDLLKDEAFYGIRLFVIA